MEGQKGQKEERDICEKYCMYGLIKKGQPLYNYLTELDKNSKEYKEIIDLCDKYMNPDPSDKFEELDDMLGKFREIIKIEPNTKLKQTPDFPKIFQSHKKKLNEMNKSEDIKEALDILQTIKYVKNLDGLRTSLLSTYIAKNENSKYGAEYDQNTLDSRNTKVGRISFPVYKKAEELEKSGKILNEEKKLIINTLIEFVSIYPRKRVQNALCSDDYLPKILGVGVVPFWILNIGLMLKYLKSDQILKWLDDEDFSNFLSKFHTMLAKNLPEAYLDNFYAYLDNFYVYLGNTKQKLENAKEELFPVFAQKKVIMGILVPAGILAIVLLVSPSFGVPALVSFLIWIVDVCCMLAYSFYAYLRRNSIKNEKAARLKTLDNAIDNTFNKGNYKPREIKSQGVQKGNKENKNIPGQDKYNMVGQERK